MCEADCGGARAWVVAAVSAVYVSGWAWLGVVVVVVAVWILMCVCDRPRGGLYVWYGGRRGGAVGM